MFVCLIVCIVRRFLVEGFTHLFSWSYGRESTLARCPPQLRDFVVDAIAVAVRTFSSQTDSNEKKASINTAEEGALPSVSEGEETVSIQLPNAVEAIVDEIAEFLGEEEALEVGRELWRAAAFSCLKSHFWRRGRGAEFEEGFRRMKRASQTESTEEREREREGREAAEGSAKGRDDESLQARLRRQKEVKESAKEAIALGKRPRYKGRNAHIRGRTAVQVRYSQN